MGCVKQGRIDCRVVTELDRNNARQGPQQGNHKWTMVLTMTKLGDGFITRKELC